jgi:hypothetical protein
MKNPFRFQFSSTTQLGKGYNVLGLKTPQRKSRLGFKFSSKPNSEKVMLGLQTQQNLRRKSRFGFKFPPSDENQRLGHEIPPIRNHPRLQSFILILESFLSIAPTSTSHRKHIEHPISLPPNTYSFTSQADDHLPQPKNLALKSPISLFTHTSKIRLPLSKFSTHKSN